MTTPFDNLTKEEKENLVCICKKLEHDIEEGDWYYSNQFLNIDNGFPPPFTSLIPTGAIWIPNGDQWKWVPGWDMDCGSVVDEVKQPDGSWKKLNVILNAMKPCEAVVSEHENAIYAHALAWDKFTKED